MNKRQSERRLVCLNRDGESDTDSHNLLFLFENSIAKYVVLQTILFYFKGSSLFSKL